VAFLVSDRHKSSAAIETLQSNQSDAFPIGELRRSVPQVAILMPENARQKIQIATNGGWPRKFTPWNFERPSPTTGFRRLAFVVVVSA
jgi:hypothetical protein